LDIDSQVLLFVGGAEKFCGFLISLLIKLQELTVLGEDAIAGFRALNGTTPGVRVWIRLGLCRTSLVDQNHV
jgi:hypothetical protein